MSDGLRDAFIENDAIGNYNIGTSPLGGVASRRSGKRRKKARRSVSHVHRKRKRKHARKAKHSHSKHTSRKGRKYPHWLKKYWFKKKKR